MPTAAQLKSAMMSAVSSAPPPETESMRRLKALKERIARELEHEHRERVEAETRDPIVPLSLAAAAESAGGGAGAKRGGGGGAAAKAQQQQSERLLGLTREKIAGMKHMDKYLQRELEVELDKSAQEQAALRAQSQRLREIVRLRKESNTRREAQMEGEIARLKALTDATCVDAVSPERAMDELRGMNRQIQDGAAQLQATIEGKAEAERLALIRTYRVRMRELKQQLVAQEAANLDGASAWIRRFELLDGERQAAEAGLRALESRIAVLEADNSELRVVRRHQDDQRSALTTKVAIVNRENSRFDAHIARLEAQLRDTARAAPGQQQPQQQPPQSRLGDTIGSQQPTPPSREALRSRGRQTSSSQSQQRPWALTALPPGERRQAEALAKVRRTLDGMRRQLRAVRTAHLELLQERTELELFLRQCIEDVRRDRFRFTVVTTVARGVKGDELEERAMLESYGVAERKRLLDILASKLDVLAQLHRKMFPERELPLPAEETLGDHLARATDRGGAEAVDASIAAAEAVAEEQDADTLWERWKQWTRSVTPSL